MHYDRQKQTLFFNSIAFTHIYLELNHLLPSGSPNFLMQCLQHIRVLVINGVLMYMNIEKRIGIYSMRSQGKIYLSKIQKR